MSFKSFNWLRDGVLPLSLAIMFVSWLSLWVVWLGSWPVFSYKQAALSPLAMVFIVVASSFLTRMLLRQEDWPLGRVQALISGLGFAVVLFTVGREHFSAYFLLDPRWLGELFVAMGRIFKGFSPQLAGLLLGAFLWWRGIIQGRQAIDFDRILRAFRFGILMLVILLVLSVGASATEGLKAIQGQTVSTVLVFFTVGLAALALSRLEEVRHDARKQGMRGPGFGNDWLVAVVVSVLAVVFFGFVVSSLFSADLVARLTALLQSVREILVIPVLYIALLIGYFVQYLIYFIQYLVSLFGLSRPESARPPQSPFEPRKTDQPTGLDIPLWLLDVMQWALVAAVGALIIFFFVKAITRLGRQDQEEEGEEVHESLWSWQVFLNELRAWFRSLLQRFARKQKAAVKQAAFDRFRTDPQYHISQSIRQIYQNLLSQAANLGVPKQPAVTPYEYLAILSKTVPAGRDDLAAITEAYVRVRYGGRPAVTAEFVAVDQAWSRVRAAFRSLEEGAGPRR